MKKPGAPNQADTSLNQVIDKSINESVAYYCKPENFQKLYNLLKGNIFPNELDQSDIETLIYSLFGRDLFRSQDYNNLLGEAPISECYNFAIDETKTLQIPKSFFITINNWAAEYKDKELAFMEKWVAYVLYHAMKQNYNDEDLKLKIINATLKYLNNIAFMYELYLEQRNDEGSSLLTEKEKSTLSTHVDTYLFLQNKEEDKKFIFFIYSQPLFAQCFRLYLQDIENNNHGIFISYQMPFLGRITNFFYYEKNKLVANLANPNPNNQNQLASTLVGNQAMTHQGKNIALVVAGTLLIATSVSLFIASSGVLLPVSLGAIATGAFLIAAGVAGVAGSNLVMAGMHNFFQQNKKQSSSVIRHVPTYH